MNETPFRSALQERLLTRRSLLAAATGLATAATLAACAPVSSPSSSSTTGGGKKLKLTMFVFLGGNLGVMPKEFVKDYTEKHPNVSIELYEQSNAVGYGKMLAQRKANPDAPLVNFGFFNTSTTAQGIGDKMWTTLDYSAMSNAKDITPTFTRADHYGIGIGSDQLGLVYNTKYLSTAPTSWADLWQGRKGGQLSFFGFPWYAVYMAAKANGGSITDMDPGFALWEKNAKLIRVLVESNPQYLNVLSDGTAPLTSYFAGTGEQWRQGGAPLSYVVPEEGAIPVPVYLQSVADQTDDQKAVVQDIINEMIAPKWANRWAETSVQIPANSLAKTPADLAKLPAFQKSTVDGFLTVDWDTIGAQTPAWTDKWNADVATKI
ncbi:MAG TPA: extracellular solute-binding protein [Gryllotalpicola sp.]